MQEVFISENSTISGNFFLFLSSNFTQKDFRVLETSKESKVIDPRVNGTVLRHDTGSRGSRCLRNFLIIQINYESSGI